MYKYKSTKKVITGDPILNRLAQKALHRGSSGDKSKMWVATKTLFGKLVEKFPRRFPEDMKIREFRGMLKEELVGV